MNNSHLDLLNLSKPKGSKTTEDLIKGLDDIITVYERCLNTYKEMLIRVKQCPFVEGDIVSTKDGAVSIVCGIGFGIDDPSKSINPDTIEKLYAVLATKSGYKLALIGDILPYNKTTKVLFNNERS